MNATRAPKARPDAAAPADGVGSLRRLGGGRWQTRDSRFTIEPQSGTWAVVDAEQTDELGLPLVRGPYRSLTEAKEAIGEALSEGEPASPLAERLKAAAEQPPRKVKDRPAGGRKEQGTGPAGPPPPPPEPRWLADLPAADKERARRMIERLTVAGATDPEGLVRQDLAGGIPSLARFALADRLAGLVASPSGAEDRDPERLARAIADLFASGSDKTLDVGWRLLDRDDRPIELSPGDIRAALERQG